MLDAAFIQQTCCNDFPGRTCNLPWLPTTKGNNNVFLNAVDVFCLRGPFNSIGRHIPVGIIACSSSRPMQTGTTINTEQVTNNLSDGLPNLSAVASPTEGDSII